VVHFPMLKNQTRRNFLRIAPCAAAAALPLSNAPVFAQASPDGGGVIAHEPFQIYTAQAIAEAAHQLQANSGNKMLFQSKALPVAVTLTTETKKSGKEFEYHEGRDHVIQIVEGTTLYEVGGTPKNARNVKPGEWLAPISEGSTAITMHKGDMLILPRGTPHKRSTEGSVTLTLIATTGALAGAS
jgi:mannose-6-phosphate isomerase-like protein (cupin superfamily)